MKDFNQVMKEFSSETDKEINNYMRTMTRLTKNLNIVHSVNKVEETDQDMTKSPIAMHPNNKEKDIQTSEQKNEH